MICDMNKQIEALLVERSGYEMRGLKDSTLSYEQIEKEDEWNENTPPRTIMREFFTAAALPPS